MQIPPDDRKQMPQSKMPDVPSKADFLAILDQESGRAGLQLEWMLDHCDKLESKA